MRAQAFLTTALLGALAVPGFGLPFAFTTAVSPAPTWPHFLPLLPIVSIAGLLQRIATAKVRAAALTGWTWGLGCFLGGVSWLYVSLSQFSGLPAAAAAAATLLFVAFLALYPMLACAAYATLRDRHGEGLRVALFAALWALGEWLRGTLFTGFPWLSLGYAQVPPSPLAGYASSLGVYGVGFISVLVAGTLVQLRNNGKRRSALVTLVLVLGIGALLRAMVWVSPVGEPITVRLLQGNVPQAVKWEPEHLKRSVNSYLGLLNQLARDPAKSSPTAATLTVLPETAIPLLFTQIPEEVIAALTRQSDTLLGVAVGTLDGGYANAAMALPKGKTSPEGIYAKAHLVPFGEYAPPGFGWFFKLLRIPMSDFTAGAPRQSPLLLAGQQVAPNICYEDLFGEELLPALRDATLLINLSNTAWFGDSLAQPQHLQIARLRALETGRVMLRATNSGMTAMILPNGEVAARLAPFTSAVLQVEAQGYSGLTPYSKWGNALILSICLLTLGWQLKRRGQPGSAITATAL
jgi:apolipoprotein N-acyltransferase